ncbi:MAG: hypothetical protein CMM07_25795 [Rhodopirellula sp.]|nr:hypothetical protein [Rhodopirellula sp.]
MPFDATPSQTSNDLSVQIETLCNIALGNYPNATGKKANLSERRAIALQALAMTSSAITECDPNADYIDLLELAETLGSLIPVPKVKAPTIDPSLGEWCEYTDAQRRGSFKSFYGGRQASFRFADGQVIKVQLPHRTNKDQPDWQRASVCAVSFYKAMRVRQFQNLVCDYSEHAETYARGCAVPEIVQAIDITRDVECNVQEANRATEQERSGFTYLAELSTFAAEQGGRWMSAWQIAKQSTARALHRQSERALAACPVNALDNAWGEFSEWSQSGLDTAEKPSNRITAQMDTLARSIGPDAIYDLMMSDDKPGWYAAKLRDNRRSQIAQTFECAA